MWLLFSKPRFKPERHCTLFVMKMAALIPILAIVFLSGNIAEIAMAQEVKRPFTVAEEIGITLFGTPNGGDPEIRFSPNGKYVAVWSERGSLELNQVEDSLRFYYSRDLEDFIARTAPSKPPSAMWIVTRFGKEGPVVNDWRWLADSTGIAYLERASDSHQQLVLADVRSKEITILTSTSERVKAFDICDRQHYVYTVVDPSLRQRIRNERRAPAIVGTGLSSYQLLFPDSPVAREMSSSRDDLRAVVNGKRFEVKKHGASIGFESLFGEDLALSPDGQSLVTMMTVPEVPPSWETLYPPPVSSSPYRIHSVRRNLQSDSYEGAVHVYVRIDLQTGLIESLAGAPVANDGGWWAGGTPSWSSDGQAVLLPGTFLKSKDLTPSRPCVAVVDLRSKTSTCVERLKGHAKTDAEENYHLVTNVRFVDGDKGRVMVTFRRVEDWALMGTEYRRTTDGTWKVARSTDEMPKGNNDHPQVSVKQAFDQPPLLIVANKWRSKVLWDPNPQLRNVELGQARVYNWKDKDGRQWRGGLYKPTNYEAGQRYPLVIQTHGFDQSQFKPSGVFTTAFAARALAGAGIFVLQIGGACPSGSQEGACYVAGFESAANQLISEGLVNPDKIGIIGFSRTCFHVMEMLTKASLHVKAAIVADGIMETYLQYMVWLDPNNESNSVIGAPPFAEGLQQWFKASPGFNLDKVTTPIAVIANGRPSLLYMWEVYAGLRYLNKPVDLVLLQSGEHVLTNPTFRMASQGGSVDWFRFWLTGNEDPDPAKAPQYVRWRELRRLQENQQMVR